LLNLIPVKRFHTSNYAMYLVRCNKYIFQKE